MGSLGLLKGSLEGHLYIYVSSNCFVNYKTMCFSTEMCGYIWN